MSSRLNHSPKTLAFNTSFFPHAIAIWNSLAKKIILITEQSTFRQSVTAHIQ
ncbi:unnamed protein product [Ixodes persulcatus]